jgi:hypothetical protein
MQSSHQSAATSLPALTGVLSNSQRQGDLAYQIMTIAAMLVLLFSLWVF